MSDLTATRIEEIPSLQGPSFDDNADAVAARVRDWFARGCSVQFNWHVLQKELANGVDGLAPAGLVERFLAKTHFASDEEQTAEPSGNESGPDENPRVDLILTLFPGVHGTDWRDRQVIYCKFAGPEAQA